jgi:predicted nucleotidyltransferase
MTTIGTKFGMDDNRTKKLSELKDILLQVMSKSENVLFAYIFGSHIAGMITESSDMDVAVYLDKKHTDIDDFLSLHSALSRALKTDKIDLVLLNNANNLILLDSIVRHGILVIDKDKDRREEFELRVLHSAIDFREQRKAIIGR